MPASARSFRNPQSGNRMGEMTNEERLRAYDQAASAEQNPGIAQQRFGLAQQKEAFDEAQKQAASQSREQQLSTTNQFNEQKMAAMEAEGKAKESLQNLNLDTQTKMFQETAAAAKALQGIDPSSPDARKQVLQVIADNPYGSLHPAVKQFSDSILESAKANQMAQQKLTEVDPLKMAAQIRGQIGTYEKQAEGLDKTISDLSAGNENFTKTTGIFKDSDGQMKFGRPDKGFLAGGQPVASATDIALYNQYQSALQQKAALTSKIPQLNTQLDNVLNGNLPPPTSPAAQQQPSQNGSALPSGLTPVPDQPQQQPASPVTLPVAQAAQTAAQVTGAPPPVAAQVAQASVQPTQPVPAITPQPEQGPTPTGASADLAVLARQAMNDPNATDAHRAAAQRILGNGG